jgi:hypothetical protein
VTNPKLAELGAKAAIEIAKPAYEDAVQPAAREVGQAGKTLGGLVRVALRPIQSLTLAGDLFFERVDGWLRESLGSVPEEKLVEPPPNIAGPLLLNLAFAQDQDELRRLYVELLAKAMQADLRSTIHPAFVDIVKSLSPREALLLETLAASDRHPLLVARVMHKDGSGWVGERLVSAIGDASGIGYEEVEVLLYNLDRIGIVQIIRDQHLLDKDAYEPLRSEVRLKTFRDVFLADGTFSYGDAELLLLVTPFGAQFLKACLPLKASP